MLHPVSRTYIYRNLTFSPSIYFNSSPAQYLSSPLRHLIAPTMRFSTTAISLFGLIVGSSALLPGDPVDPGYTRSWDFVVDSQGKLGRAPSPVLLDNGQV